MPAKNLQRLSKVGTYAHVYNKGVENRIIFAEESDYQVFLSFLEEYLSAPSQDESKKAEFTVNGRVYRGIPHQPKNYFKKVELLAYSLKPDHFHLLLHQKTQKSLQALIRSLCTRYSIYFNKKYNRTGGLFDGPYKLVQLENVKGLFLLTQYLNKESDHSTHPEYSGQRSTHWVKTKVVLTATSNNNDRKNLSNNYKFNLEENQLLEKIAIEKIGKHDQHLERRNLEIVSLKPWSRIPELFLASAVFALLLGFGLKNVTTFAKNTTSTTLGTKIISNDPTPIDTPQPSTPGTVKNTDATAAADIQNKDENN